jgi:hypothetical protein
VAVPMLEGFLTSTVVEILSQAPQTSLDSQNGVLIILTVILAHVASLVVVFLPDGLGDLGRANARPESRA